MLVLLFPALGLVSLGSVTHLSPLRALVNWFSKRQARRGPTRAPGRSGSAMAPIQMSMLSGVPYRFRNFLARPWFFSTRLSCARFLGWESPQKRRQALYPEGKGAEAVSVLPLLSSHSLLLLSTFLSRALWPGNIRQNKSPTGRRGPEPKAKCQQATLLCVHHAEECLTLETVPRTQRTLSRV